MIHRAGVCCPARGALLQRPLAARAPPARRSRARCCGAEARASTNGRRTRPQDGGVVDRTALRRAVSSSADDDLLDRYWRGKGVADAARRAALSRVGGGGDRSSVLRALRVAGCIEHPEMLASQVDLLEKLVPGAAGARLIGAVPELMELEARTLAARCVAVTFSLGHECDAVAYISQHPEVLLRGRYAAAHIARHAK